MLRKAKLVKAWGGVEAGKFVTVDEDRLRALREGGFVAARKRRRKTKTKATKGEGAR